MVVAALLLIINGTVIGLRATAHEEQLVAVRLGGETVLYRSVPANDQTQDLRLCWFEANADGSRVAVLRDHQREMLVLDTVTAKPLASIPENSRHDSIPGPRWMGANSVRYVVVSGSAGADLEPRFTYTAFECRGPVWKPRLLGRTTQLDEANYRLLGRRFLTRKGIAPTPSGWVARDVKSSQLRWTTPIVADSVARRTVYLLSGSLYVWDWRTHRTRTLAGGNGVNLRFLRRAGDGRVSATLMVNPQAARLHPSFPTHGQSNDPGMTDAYSDHPGSETTMTVIFDLRSGAVSFTPGLSAGVSFQP